MTARRAVIENDIDIDRPVVQVFAYCSVITSYRPVPDPLLISLEYRQDIRPGKLGVYERVEQKCHCNRNGRSNNPGRTLTHQGRLGKNALAAVQLVGCESSPQPGSINECEPAKDAVRDSNHHAQTRQQEGSPGRETTQCLSDAITQSC